MNSKLRKKYLCLMRECCYRIEALRDLISGTTYTTYLQTDIESEALQLRKILELIAFSTLVSHKDAYLSIRKDIAKDWHAERILRKIEKINPNFYPVPVERNNRNSLRKVQGGFLTRKQFEHLYDNCGAILHSKNPFARGKCSLAFHK